ncbi:MAG: hypothetical protein FIA96_15770 [Betaproteobacteria bacterium]|jgi:hypothetical protein|nr:hypothetical protein [Betaproteobacteria bacterium]
MKKHLLPLLLASLLISLGIGGVSAQAAKPPLAEPAGEAPSKPISAVEQRVFLDDHLGNLAKTADIEYSFKRSGTLGDNFEDMVVLHVRDGGKEKGRLASADFLSGKSTLKLPEIPNPQGNPVVLYFLERDVREMERITKGKQYFFRKRVRLALADADQVKPVTVRFEGRDIKADEVRVQPYLNDPVMHARAEKYEKKAYIFTLSDQVPGGVYQIRTTVAAADEKADAPLVDETMTFAKLRKQTK